MNKLIFLSVILSFTVGNLSGQYESGMTYPDTTSELLIDSLDVSALLANTILEEDLYNHLSILASDEFEGRETGTRGNTRAAKYIANYFKELGIKPRGIENSYYQDVAFNKTYWTETKVEVNGNAYRHLWDYMTFPSMTDQFQELSSDEVIFLGYGIDDQSYSDYKGNDVQGKIIMINKGEPFNQDSISYISSTRESSEWTSDINMKLKVAQEKGVKMVLIIEEDLRKLLDKNRRFLVSPSLKLGDGEMKTRTHANHMYISSNVAKDIIGNKDEKIKKWRKKNLKNGKACDIKLNSQLGIQLSKKKNVLKGHNVFAFIEGTDLKEEVIAVSAHYDHLGKRGEDIFNGADDNGTGTSTVLEITEALTEAIKKGIRPRRSILLLLVTGEEKGLLGSRYYAENPIYPIENTVANVNIDMIGRTDKKHEENPNYTYVIGSDRLSSDLHKINEEINHKYSRLILDYQYNGEDDPNRYYYRSDHYNFAKKGIPAIFFFSGTHEDYHRPSDTVDKIMFDKLTKIGRHVFHLIWDLANRNDRIIVDGKVEN